ncbi:hypothetical protein D0469_05860, partial [Peribacillus saganii]
MLLRGLTCPAAPAGVFAPSTPINRLLNVYYGTILKSILKLIHKMIEESPDAQDVAILVVLPLWGCAGFNVWHRTEVEVALDFNPARP